MQPLADYMGKTVEEVATQILTRAYEKIEPIIMDLADKYRLEKDQIRSWLWEEKQAQGMLRQIPVLLERYVPYEQQNLFE